LVISCQDEKSQLQNRARAMQILRARLYAMERERQREEQTEARRSQVGSGERSEKVRTYNFPQNRVTDHRIGLTLHRLDSVLEGDLDELIDGLTAAEQAEKMARLGEV
jgi:peptide chain release factor 1